MKNSTFLPSNTVKRLLRKGMMFWEYFRVFETKKDRRSMLQSEALYFLSKNQTATMTEIAEYLKISTPAATSLIDRMHRQSLVSRKLNPQNRRQFNISLTKQGKRLHKKIQDEMEAEMARIFVGIDKSEAEVYMKIQDKIISNMKEIVEKRYRE